MFYVPDRKDAYETCVALADFPDLAISHTKSAVAIQSKAPGDASHIDMSALTFSGRVYLYHLDWMSLTQLGSLEELYRKKNYSIVFRGPNYSADKIAHEKADALNKHG